jgi:hypothetical protein
MISRGLSGHSFDCLHADGALGLIARAAEDPRSRFWS